MKKSLFLCIAIAVIAFTSCTPRQKAPSGEVGVIQTILDEEAKRFLQDSMVTAVSIGVFKNGQKVSAHYGELDLDQGNTPTDQTIYEIASVTKTFTGALVAQAALDHKLSLEDDVRTYLGADFENLAYQGNPVRIKHLLLHEAGFPQWLPTAIGNLMTAITPELPFQVHALESAYSKPQFFEDLKGIALTAPPGTTYGYSNVDVELTAYILEKVYGMSYDELLKTYITTPANMPSTKIRLSEGEAQHLAQGYGINRRRTPHMPNKLWGADGGLKATTPDLVNYMEFLLTSDTPMVKQSQEIIKDLGEYGAGYFWPIRISKEDGIYYNHHGGAYGTQNWFYIYPKYNIGISVVTNQSDLYTAGKLQNTVEAIFKKLKTHGQ